MATDFTNALQNKLKKAVASLPVILANEAVNHSLDAFKAQAWDGQQWRRRIYRKGQGSSILIKSGRGRRGMRVISTSATGFVYGNDVPYMAAHNRGFSGTVKVKAYKRNKYSKSKQGTGKFTKSGKERMKTVSTLSGSKNVKAHTRRMNLPRRQFAGKSQQLMQRLINKGQSHILKAFK